MLVDMTERKFILTCVSGRTRADIICCSDNIDFMFMKDTLRLRGYSFQILSRHDAIKLLLEGGYLNYGCYLKTGDAPRDRFNRAVAHTLYLNLSSLLGIVRNSDPCELDPKEIEIDTVPVSARSL
jgi:hypothetical protein